MQLDESQQAAIEFAVNHRAAMITGSAGTGKTTIIKAIANNVVASGGNIALCAFAGKAAARIREATGFDACTVHRLLGWNGLTFTRKSLHGMTVIVDEASMLPNDLLAALINAHPLRLILVGDAAQLPPVGSGRPFHDLIEYAPDKTHFLTTCYRNSEAIFKAATAIRRGDRPLYEDTTDGEHWSWQHTGKPEATQQFILGMIAKGDFDFEQDAVLVCRNGKTDEDYCTIRTLNAAIAAVVNPREGEEKFKVGDRVINTKNLAELDVWNGTTGTIHDINADNDIIVRLDEPVTDFELSTTSQKVTKDYVTFCRDTKKHLELAYALTVHKAQGSQYRRVIIALFNRDAKCGLLDRSMAYTAVTRARQECLVVGERGALFDGICNVNKKMTVIQELAKGNAA